MFRSPMINLHSRDADRLAAFYGSLGFRETFRAPGHVELTLDGFTPGIASVQAAMRHGLSPNLQGRPVEIVLRSDDTDAAYARLTAGGTPSLGAPHDFLDGRLRSAWVADPDGNPIQLVRQRRTRRSRPRTHKRGRPGEPVLPRPRAAMT